MPNVTEGTEMGQAARIWSLPDSEIGGAFVRRGFTRGDLYLKAGSKLTADEVRSIPMTNRRALAVSGALDIYPVAASVTVPADFSRFIIHRGGGQFNVIEGRMLNTEGLTKEEADKLANA